MIALIPLAQARANGRSLCAIRQSVDAVMFQIATCMLGGLLYALHFPEAYIPGKFDRWGHSHQLFHICVAVAFVMQHLNSSALWMWRSTDGLCEAPRDTCLVTFGPHSL
jgi:predicted membrane channel-forming protein YqfA (hemolysin III family)